MDENLDLVKILKDCPVGTKLYSTVYGESKFRGIVDGTEPIATESYSRLGVKGTFYTSDGRVNQYSHGECVLFPSRDQRDWSKFERFWNKPKRECFDPKILQPFDRVLARYNKACRWKALFFSHFYMTQDGEDVYVCDNAEYMYCIPFDDNTKHLVGTKNEAPEYYRYWED